MREEDGVRLDVAVDDAVRVEEGKGLKTGLTHSGDLLLIHSVTHTLSLTPYRMGHIHYH